MAWTLDKTKMTASNATPAAGSSVGNVNGPAKRATGRKGKAFAKWKPRPMLKPTPEDYVIVMKPRERISLQKAFTETGYGDRHLGAADRLIGDFAVNTEKGSVPLHGYLRQDGGNTCHGVIMCAGVPAPSWKSDNSEHPRRHASPSRARRSPVTRITDNMVVSVQSYYKTIRPAASVGPSGTARMHVQTYSRTRWRECGPLTTVFPGVLCAVVTHATNSRDCAAKFRTPKMAAKKGGKKKMAPKNKTTSRHHTAAWRNARRRRRTAKLGPGSISSKTDARLGGPYTDVSGRPLKTSSRTTAVDDDDSCSLSSMEDSALLVSAGSGAASPKIRRSQKTHSATPVHIVQWNCRGFQSRAKWANLRLFLLTLDSLPAVVALHESGSGATLTSYITFQQDPSSCPRSKGYGQGPYDDCGRFQHPHLGGTCVRRRGDAS
ncbi:hypothetical protein HPB49_021992 [Dermacentor silvarum]|uniref:Uncharacterized protein n=1 Tax=Dermacentor silvarum TaxID=543639 RepID=A0ACB8CMP6_DERSI|nr:hypothetical protein HPB49_021992 [Dermacentor silvarum]